MMTDKATVEMESPVSGIVVELAGEVGDRIAIGSTLVVIETDEEGAADTLAGQKNLVETQDAGEVPGAEVAPSAPAAAPAPTPALAPAPVAAAAHSRAVLASPAVRARAKDLGVDLGQVHAEGDRIRHADLDAFLRYSGGQGYHAPGASRARADEPIKVHSIQTQKAEGWARGGAEG